MQFLIFGSIFIVLITIGLIVWTKERLDEKYGKSEKYNSAKIYILIVAMLLYFIFIIHTCSTGGGYSKFYDEDSMPERPIKP